METGVRIGAVQSLLCRHRSEAVGFGLRRLGSVQRHRHRSHGHGSKRVEPVTTVDFHLESKAPSGPIDRSQFIRTLDTADGKVDQAEFVGHDPIVGFRPDGSVCCISQSKTNVQGCIFQCIAVRIAGDGLVSNPIALLGLGGKSRHQHHCGQEERAHQIHLG